MNILLADCVKFLKEKPNNFRSSKKTDILHSGIADILKKSLPPHVAPHIEYGVDSLHSSGRKRCDIVFTGEDDRVHYIFPVKFPMSSVGKNVINREEESVGEATLIRLKHRDVRIEPINILPFSVDVERFKNHSRSMIEAKIFDDYHLILYDEDLSVKNIYSNKIF